MALRTLGTNATTTLSGIIWYPGGLLPADLAAVSQAINNDGIGNAGVIGPDDYTTKFSPISGILGIPRRGVLTVQPGDFVAVDAAGWPIVISAQSLAYGSTSWTHT